MKNNGVSEERYKNREEEGESFLISNYIYISSSCLEPTIVIGSLFSLSRKKTHFFFSFSLLISSLSFFFWFFLLFFFFFVFFIFFN